MYPGNISTWWSHIFLITKGFNRLTQKRSNIHMDKATIFLTVLKVILSVAYSGSFWRGGPFPQSIGYHEREKDPVFQNFLSPVPSFIHSGEIALYDILYMFVSSIFFLDQNIVSTAFPLTIKNKI
jgi:hypothetical protein